MGGSGRFDVFTDLVLFDTSGASGGHIFRCTTKDMGERRAKGAAAPVGSPGVMLTGFAESARREFALVPRPNFNQGRRWRLSPPLRAYCALTVMPSIAGRSALGVRCVRNL